jgi:hypothetical protein
MIRAVVHRITQELLRRDTGDPRVCFVTPIPIPDNTVPI